MSPRYVITADPPTPNGDLHVGHLSGPYFAADALARALRLRGHEAAHLSNFDAHQTYVVSTGRKLGLSPAEVVDRFERRITETLELASMKPDLMRAPDEAQKAFVRRFFEDLYVRGHLLVRDEPIPYCGRCRHHMFETYVQGECPYCGAPCYGNTCEVCVLPHRTASTVNPRCRHCGEAPSGTVTYRGLFLPLSRHQERLRAYVETRRGIWRQRLLDLVLPRLDRPMPDIPLSFVCDYGLPVSIDGFPGQVYNVRLEIIAALLHTYERWCAERGAPEAAPEDLRMVCFHGYENGYQYGVSFHTLLLLSELGWGPPYASISNEFYLLEGKKFSTTRRHAVWGKDILERVDADLLRFYLAWTNPEESESDFVLEDFRATTDHELVEPWNRAVERIGRRLSEGETPGAVSEPFTRRLAELDAKLRQAYAVESFSLRRAARATADVVALLAGREIGLADALAGAAALSAWAEPVMPRFAQRLRERLGAPRAWPTLPPEALRPEHWGDDLRLPPLAEAELSGLI